MNRTRRDGIAFSILLNNHDFTSGIEMFQVLLMAAMRNIVFGISFILFVSCYTTDIVQMALYYMYQLTGEYKNTNQQLFFFIDTV